MAETHVNAFKADVEAAKTEVFAVLGEAWSKVDALVAKLEGANPTGSSEPVATPAVTPEVPQVDTPSVDKVPTTSTK